jgi:hypothetical protein
VLVCRASGFCCGDILKKQRFCLDSEDFSLALQYSSEVSLFAILLHLRVSQEQGVRKETRTMVDLKQNFREEVAEISPNMLQQVTQSFQKCLGECVDNKGCHLTDTIFRK